MSRPSSKSGLSVATEFARSIRQFASTLVSGLVCCVVFANGCREAPRPVLGDEIATLIAQARLHTDSGPALTTITGLVATDQYVFVGQENEQEILVYANDGAYVRTIGRAGSGPGEFVALRRFGVAHDTIWTIDWGQLRLSRFNTRGELLDDLNLEPYRVPDHALASPFTLMPE